jgi:cytochrome c553
MLKHALLAMFGAGIGLAVAVSSAMAADDVEAKAQVCAACHGQNGTPADAKTIPPIWGQQVSYLTKQLHDYKSGDRKNPIMAQIAGGLEQQDLRPVAAYFAAKSWPATPASAPAAPAAPPAGLALCQACHQPHFEGGLPAPRLAGLSYEYLVASMDAFAKGERTNNQDMPKIMQTLSESQRQAMAKYLSQL